ncbi:MAG TPA: hypothetical protein VGD72_07315 [Mycobacteriales bacterium]
MPRIPGRPGGDRPGHGGSTPTRRRPSSADPAALGFTPRPPVRWLSPTELARTAVSVVLSDIFGAYADKRELQQCGVFEQGTFGHDRGGEIWLDFTADLGDGFDATYSVASLLAAPGLEIGGVSLPRGEVLVLGGDEVYPVGSAESYEQRTTRVYAAALPESAGPRPTLYAVPGNHDWYDGLTAFLRVFAQQKTIGGWDTAQRRSYFALRLPGGWWLLALDIQLDAYIDQPQLAYFRTVAEQFAPGDGVILCTAKPSWYQAGRGEEGSFRRLGYFAEQVLAGTGAHLRLVLTGDSHHYSRYTDEATGQTLLTAGLGGAYTSATHLLPERLTIPSRLVAPGAPPEPVTYDRAARTWPPQATSRREAAGVLGLPLVNPGFWALLGAVQAAFVASVLTRNVLSWVTTAVLIVVAAVWFADPERGGRWARVRYGLPHAAAQLLLGYAAYRVAAALTGSWARWVAAVAATPAVMAVAGLAAAEVTAVYLLLASRGGANVNELFAAQSRDDHKGFVRIHLRRDGDLRVYPVGIARPGRRWRANPDTAPGAPWLLPRKPLTPELIERPFTITREPPPA